MLSETVEKRMREFVRTRPPLDVVEEAGYGKAPEDAVTPKAAVPATVDIAAPIVPISSARISENAQALDRKEITKNADLIVGQHAKVVNLVGGTR